eukprot:NP_493421.3 Uncharacterized protein CELE_W04A8.2 [Caenorhabditis elegans]
MLSNQTRVWCHPGKRGTIICKIFIAFGEYHETRDRTKMEDIQTDLSSLKTTGLKDNPNGNKSKLTEESLFLDDGVWNVVLSTLDWKVEHDLKWVDVMSDENQLSSESLDEASDGVDSTATLKTNILWPFDEADNDVHIDFCGQTVPGRPMNLDFENNKFVEAYVQLQETLGHTRNNFSCNSIDIGMLRSKGYTIFGFELSPVAQDNSLFELVRQTNVCVRLNFKTETPVGGLYCVVYAEFDQIFALDFMRNSIIDSIV